MPAAATKAAAVGPRACLAGEPVGRAEGVAPAAVAGKVAVKS